MFSSEKASENQLLESLEPCFSLLFLASAYFWSNTSNPAGIKFHFRLDSNQQFQGRLWFSIRPIIHFMVTFVIGSLIHMYSISYMHDENMHKYFAYLNLFI
jgi:NADH-quinone oxidoreductase subunit L